MTPEEEWPEEWPEITPEEENYIRDEGLALQLLSDFLHVPSPEVKDGKLVLVGGKSTEDEARRALCRILLDEEWGPSAEVCHALVAVFDPDATDAALKAVLKRRSRGHANPYADGAIAEAVSLLRFRGKHYDDAKLRWPRSLEKAQSTSNAYLEKVPDRWPGCYHGALDARVVSDERTHTMLSDRVTGAITSED